MIDEPTVRGIECAFFQCLDGVGQEGFHAEMIQFLLANGATFYKAAPFPPPVEENPNSNLKPEGRLNVSIAMSHAVLHAEDPTKESQAGFLARYGNKAVRNSFRVSCTGWRDDADQFEKNIQQLAVSRVAFMKFLIPEVKPKFAYADDVWVSNITDSHLRKSHTPRLYWTTYFGPRFVEMHGHDFLMNTPAWKTEELEGGVLVTVTEKFLDFATAEPKDSLKYLRQKFKAMRANRFRIHEAF